MSYPFASRNPVRFDLPPGQVIDQAGRRMVLVGRARDRTRRLLFEDSDGIQRDFSDEELVALQAEGKLLLLTAAEVEAKPHAGGRPPITLDFCADRAVAAALSKATMLKFAYVAAWEAAGCPSRTAAVVAPLIARVALELGDPKPPSPRQCLRWIAAYLAAERSADGLVPQTPNRGNFKDRFCKDARNLLRDTVEEYYLVDTQSTGVWIHGRVEAVFKEHNAPLPSADRLTVPSLNAVYAEIARIDLYTKEYCRVGKRAADQLCRPIGTAPQATCANQIWEIDHTRVNCVIIDRLTGLAIGRPWVTMIIDRYSLMIVAVWISIVGPSTPSVFQCLRSAILPKTGLLEHWGVSGEWPALGRCSILIPDNGREFKAASFRAACARLGMDVQYTPVLKPWYKGTIERALQTLNRQVFERMPGTTFANIFERSREKPPESVAVATREDLWFHTLNWVVNTYNRRPHRVLGARPVDLWQGSAAQGIQPPLDPSRIDRILTPVYFCRPRRDGVEFEGVHYNAPELADLSIRADAPPYVKLVINAEELGSIGFVDPADGDVKALVPQGRLRKLMRGRTLEQHQLARALQAANRKALAGEDGLAQANIILDDAMRAKSGVSGRDNRRQALAAWTRARRVLESEDTIDDVSSTLDIAPEIFAADGQESVVADRRSANIGSGTDSAVRECEYGPTDASTPSSDPEEHDLAAHLAALNAAFSREGETP